MSDEHDQHGKPLRILLLEDSEIDAELLAGHLGKAGIPFEISRSQTRAEFVSALAEPDFDVILADYSLPDFDGLSALTIAREMRPDLPFIFVSGVVGEEFAINALRRGATDYVMKRSLSRLAAAVERAVDEFRQRDERQRAETALRELEISAQLAMGAAQLGMWSLDPRTGELRWDARCRELFGVPQDAPLTYQVFLDRCHPEDRERMTAEVERATRDEAFGGDFASEYRVVTPRGETRWLATRGHATFEDGECTRFVGVVRDVTEEKQAEEALRRLNETLEARVEERTQERDRIWRISQDLFAVAGFDGRLKTINPAWTSLLGHSERELLARPFADLIHPEDLPAAAQVIEAMRHGQNVQRFEDRLRCADGSYRWISWTAAASGDVFYAVGRDVTEERAARDELTAAHRELVEQTAERERMQETLRQMQRLEAVGQLTSGVAHDFNNLLTVILGNLGFLERSIDQAGLDGKLKQRIAMMRTAADRGATLTAQLLAFSRRQRLEPKPLNLNATVSGMRDLLQSTMGGSVRIETVLKPDLWSALVDPTQIELIILNLAINARDAMEVGGSLTLETSNVTLAPGARRPEEPGPGDYVVLSVTDTGSGMSEQVLAKVFEPFFTTKAVGRGSGLGLAQVYGFAKQSGGGVRIDTRLSEGTTVKVFLPRAMAAAGEFTPAASEAVSPTVQQRGRTILLVDDDSSVREVTAALLHEYGYAVIEAGSGGAALDILQRGAKVDLLLVDYAMPGLSGADTAREAHRLRPELKILFITGFADLTALKDVGEDCIVQKPFRHGELARKIELAFATQDQNRGSVIPLLRRS